MYPLHIFKVPSQFFPATRCGGIYHIQHNVDLGEESASNIDCRTKDSKLPAAPQAGFTPEAHKSAPLQQAFTILAVSMTRWGYGGLFSVSPPSIQRSWNGTIFLHIMKQPHEQCPHSDGYSLCLPAGIVAGLSTESCPLWGRLQAWTFFGCWN